jgi:hypothetical protein
MNLTRIRWRVRAALLLGVAASIVGNVLHAQDTLISQVISAWSPIALLITIELISRVPVHHRGLAAARLLATAVIAGIAAWVSYWHMAAVASRYGETGASPYLLPLSVDGLVVVASICLVELSGRIRSAEEEVSDGREVGADRPAGERGDHVDGSEGSGRAREADTARSGQAGGGDPPPVRSGTEGQEVAAAAPAQIKPPRKPHTANPRRVAQAHKRHPDATHEQLAERLNLSPATVKKYRPAAASEGAPPKVNGREPEFAAAGASEEES